MNASRRRFLQGLLTAFGMMTGLIRHGQNAAIGASEETGEEPGAGLIRRVASPLDAETPVENFTSFLTPTNRFFIRSHFGPPPSDLVSDPHWRLSVGGLVARPLTLTLANLAAFEEITLTAVLQCSGNGRAFYRPRTPGVQWERGAVGNAEWSGVRLRDVLAKAGVSEGARHVQCQGADRPRHPNTPLFIRSIPIEKALHPDTLLAVKMNGRPLSLLHGAPVRLITPGWMGEAWIKWVTDITVSEDEAPGYYMKTAYRYPLRPVTPGTTPPAGADMVPVERMPVKSLIAAPAHGAKLKQGLVIIEGVAWTGEARVTDVEVSVDEGRSWEAARWVGEDLPYAWRRWQYAWRAAGIGMRTIMCRATDDRGQQQPVEPVWNPGGFLWNGIDRIHLKIEPSSS